MTDDIVRRLRNGGARCGWGTDFADCPSPDDCDECACAREAANEIEGLRAYCNRYLAYAEEWQDDYRALVALVNAWAEADIAWADAPEPWEPDAAKKFTDAVMALRRAVGHD